MYQPTDYYKLLGIEFTATDSQIRKAYRQKSLLFHPDRAGNDPKAEQMFTQISEALEVLSDSNKRKLHDSLLLQKKQQELRFKEMDQTRQESKIKLEQRERLAKKQKTEQETEKLKLQELKEQTRFKIKAREQMLKQQKAQSQFIIANEQAKSDAIQNANVIDCTVKVSINSQQDETSIRNELSKYGEIERVIVGKKKASIVFKSVVSAYNACNDAESIFKIKPMGEPKAFSFLSGQSLGIQGGGFKGKEYEEITLGKLRDLS